MVKVLIADDQELIRESLKIILDSKPDIEVTDAVSDGLEVIRSVREKRPDIILLDIRMPRLDGVSCTKIIKEGYPDIKIIILTTFDDDEYVFNALKYGASGYLLKGISMDSLVEAINTVYQGQAMINPDIASKVLKFFSKLAVNNETIHVPVENIKMITKNEWTIIKEVSKGKSNREIAKDLSFSEGTVRNYLSNILDKLELRDRTQLAIWAISRGEPVSYTHLTLPRAI